MKMWLVTHVTFVPKYLSADEWIIKMYIYTMEYYSAVKKNEITGKLMELATVILIDVTQTLKDKYCIFSLMWMHLSSSRCVFQ